MTPPQAKSKFEPLPMTIMDWVRFSLCIPIRGDMKPFSFHRRQYLEPILNRNDKKIILCIARQSEKSVQEDSLVLCDGDQTPIRSINVGDRVTSMGPSGLICKTGIVTWKSRRYRKKCRRITIDTGDSVVAGLTHPFRSLDGWKVVSKLSIGEPLRVLATLTNWVPIRTLEDVGVQWCYDITVNDGESFVANGFVTHNSTTQGNRALALCAMLPYYRALYVSPSMTQTRKFSQDRVVQPLVFSPVAASVLQPAPIDNVFQKEFKNHSTIELRYANRSADRVRGVAADLLMLDELQDMLIDNVPVLEQTLSHSNLPTHCGWEAYSFTPKTMDNCGTYYWDMSTQAEMVIPCEHHGTPNKPSTWHWNVISEKNLARDGLVCELCGQPIDRWHTARGWQTMVKDAPFRGYRLPQMLTPSVQDDQWENKIWIPYTKYPRPQFFNEVMAIPFESGVRPISKGELQACCNPEWVGTTKQVLDSLNWNRVRDVFGGVDYGTGDKSWTVVALSTYVENRLFIFYYHRFTGMETDPNVQGPLIARLFQNYGVKLSVGDYGMGGAQNHYLQQKFGLSKHHQLAYVGMAKKKIYWNRMKLKWIGMREDLMTAFMNAIRDRKIMFPNWGMFEPYAQDFLNITAEFNERRQLTEYRHHPEKPDDCFHAGLYSLMAASLVNPRPDIFLSIPRPQDLA